MKSSLEVLRALSGADQMDVDWNAAKYVKEKKNQILQIVSSLFWCRQHE